MIDVLVIGGGNAALCAALMAREAGASVLLLLAGLNMAYFQFVTARSVASWDAGRASGGARFAGWASLILWAGVIACGRLAGFV